MNDELADRLDRAAADVLSLAQKRHVSESIQAPLAALAGRWRAPVAKVAVVGEISVGKSTLINALVGNRVLPDGEEPLSSVPVVVGYGPEIVATAYLSYDDELHIHPLVGSEAIAEHLTTRGEKAVRENHGRDARVLGAEVTVPSKLLASGLQLIDTPGVGGLDAAHRRRTMAALEDIDAVLFAIKPDRPINANELAFLAESADRVRSYVIVQTHRDETTDADAHLAKELARLADPATWTEPAGEERAAELAERFTGVPGVSVAAKLALDTGRVTSSHDHTGITELSRCLTENVIDQVAQIHRGDMVRLTRTVGDAAKARLDELASQLMTGELKDEPIRLREERLLWWITDDGDNWETRLHAAAATARLEITELADERIRLLRLDYRDEFDKMKPAAIKTAVAALLDEPESLLATMRAKMRTRLLEATTGITADREDDPISRGIDQWLVASEMESRLPDLSDTYRAPKTRVEVEDYAPLAPVGFAAWLRGQNRSKAPEDPHRRGLGPALATAGAALMSPPLLITLTAAAVVFTGFAVHRRRKADTVAAAKRTHTEVEEVIRGKALPHALKQATADRDAVIEGVRLLAKKEQELIAGDRAGLDDMADLSKEERDDRMKGVDFDLKWAAHINADLDDVEKG